MTIKSDQSRSLHSTTTSSNSSSTSRSSSHHSNDNFHDANDIDDSLKESFCSNLCSDNNEGKDHHNHHHDHHDQQGHQQQHQQPFRDMPTRRLSMNDSFRRSKRTISKFSILEDTETLFGTDEVYFGGPYAHIRKTLDYKYHTHYTKERQWLQDSIIDKLLHEIVQHYKSKKTSTNNSTRSSRIRRGDSIGSLGEISEHSIRSINEELCSLPSEPWLVYITGTQEKNNTNKKSAVKSLMDHDRFPILGFVLVDPEEIQTLFPEYSSYVQEYGDVQCVELMRKETGFIAEILTKAALKKGLNVIVFSTFWNVDWYPSYFHTLRLDIHCLHIAILHVLNHDEEIEGDDELQQYQHQKEQQQQQSKCLPICLPPISEECISSSRHVINSLNASERVFHAVRKLYSMVNYYCLFRISHDQNKSEDEQDLEIINKHLTWKEFSQNFKQKTVASGEDVPQGIDEMIHRGEGDFIQQFDVHKSTEENYKADHMHFYGAYAHIRETLDYTYHDNYSKYRQMLQDAIISDTLEATMIIDDSGQVCTTPTEPFLVFTAVFLYQRCIYLIHKGAMGAGKSFTLNYLKDKGLFPLLAFVGIDPDQIRQMLPEFRLYIAEDQLTAGEMTRKEAGYVVEILTLAALQAGKNVLVDTSLRDSEWYKDYFVRIRKEYPNVKLAILHIDAPREAVLERARLRGLTTGRVVPDKLLEEALSQVPKSVETLRKEVDFFCALNNAPGKEISLLTEGMTWEKFTRNWIQTCAWIPKRRSHNKLTMLSYTDSLTKPRFEKHLKNRQQSVRP